MPMTREEKAIYVATGLLKAADMVEAAILTRDGDVGLSIAQRRLIRDELNRLSDRLRSAAHGERFEAKRLDRASPSQTQNHR
jgi:hypothetical protein